MGSSGKNAKSSCRPLRVGARNHSTQSKWEAVVKTQRAAVAHFESERETTQPKYPKQVRHDDRKGSQGRQGCQGSDGRQEEACLAFRQGRTSVPSRTYPPLPQGKDCPGWTRRRNRRRVLRCHPRVPHRRGSGVGRKRLQGPQGEEDHAKASSARHQGRRGAGHPDQGHHRRRWSYPSHRQVRKEEVRLGRPLLHLLGRTTVITKTSGRNPPASAVRDSETVESTIGPYLPLPFSVLCIISLSAK